MLADLFTTFIYQPFFNVLILLYWLLGQLGGSPADMGVAVILLTLFIRFLLLPISLAGDKSEEERRAIASRIKELEAEFSHDPVRFKKEKKKLFKSKPQVVAGEIFSFGLQLGISLMLWRMFSKGLTGEDLHLMYPLMPQVETPFNLVFLGRFDLTHTSFILNLLQAVLIFVFETLSAYTSPYPVSRNEVVRLQLTLPVMSFAIFMFLPAGKKLFVITTLCFSIVLTLIKFVRRRFEAFKLKMEAKEAAASEERVVVETK